MPAAQFSSLGFSAQPATFRKPPATQEVAAIDRQGLTPGVPREAVTAQLGLSLPFN